MTWEKYAMLIAEVTKLKSKDPWVKVGCCLLRTEDNTVVTGFNGFPKGADEDWSDRDRRRRFVVHAEQNALRYIKPNECYLCAVTLLPCNDCLKSLASYGIKTIIYKDVYNNDTSSLILAKEFGIELIKYEE
jgi:dCMP deaminase